MGAHDRVHGDGVNNVFINTFWIVGLPETWITTDKLHGAIDICFTFKTSPHQLVFFLGATLFSVDYETSPAFLLNMGVSR